MYVFYYLAIFVFINPFYFHDSVLRDRKLTTSSSYYICEIMVYITDGKNYVSSLIFYSVVYERKIKKVERNGSLKHAERNY